ncbi:MAG: N-6 DNA methylase, partial [Candidatus Sumerlaeia bacterium]|nr:N-6 DNA methylase [Candidatus Sumerlaeia bacterium]
PRTDNANYLWIQMFWAALSPKGRAGFVMANSASDARGSELDIRKTLLETKTVDVMVSVGSNFFYTVTLPCTLWFFDKAKQALPPSPHPSPTGRGAVGDGDKRGCARYCDTVLFIDARHIYHQVSKALRDFLPEQLEFLANIVRLYRGQKPENLHGGMALTEEHFPGGKYRDVLGLCAVADLKKIESQGWSLNPGRYVGVKEREADAFDFKERLEELNEELEVLNREARELEERIAENVVRLLEG